jgi:hypothetical protein
MHLTRYPAEEEKKYKASIDTLEWNFFSIKIFNIHTRSNYSHEHLVFTEKSVLSFLTKKKKKWANLSTSMTRP